MHSILEKQVLRQKERKIQLDRKKDRKKDKHSNLKIFFHFFRMKMVLLRRTTLSLLLLILGIFNLTAAQNVDEELGNEKPKDKTQVSSIFKKKKGKLLF